MANVLVYLLILLFAFPVAFLLSKLCNDEIKNWRGRLLLISIISLLAPALLFIDFEFRFPILVSLIFIIIMNFTIIWISHR